MLQLAMLALKTPYTMNGRYRKVINSPADGVPDAWQGKSVATAPPQLRPPPCVIGSAQRNSDLLLFVEALFEPPSLAFLESNYDETPYRLS